MNAIPHLTWRAYSYALVRKWLKIVTNALKRGKDLPVLLNSKILTI